MAHRYTQADVERALERYRDLTGDKAAQLKRDGQGSIAIYVVDHSKGLRGFWSYGAYSAANAIEKYCDGWEDRGRVEDAESSRNARRAG